MPLTKLILAPDRTAYTVQDGVETLEVKLDGGASRFRWDIVGSTSNVTVQWSVGPENYQYLRAFYRTISSHGADPFLIDLILDEPSFTEHTVHFIPGSMRLQSQSGLKYVVAAQLEVIPEIEDSALNESIVEIINAYGGYEEPSLVFDLLETLINVDFPQV